MPEPPFGTILPGYDADGLTPDLVFRDSYLQDFLGLKDTYSERAQTADREHRHLF